MFRPDRPRRVSTKCSPQALLVEGTNSAVNPSEPVHPVAVPGETVDADHLPQHLQGGGHLALQESLQ
jgi:hypothetical protein